jgi:peptide/nickel transport system substrate-binding protein
MPRLSTFLRTSLFAAALAALGAGPPALAQKRGGDIVVGMGGGPDTLDPHFSRTQAARNVTIHVFETLIARGENMEVIPLLAESYSASPDNTAFTFKLRSNVKFHNGKTMTADDVVASLERYRLNGINKSSLADVAAIEKADAGTVVIKTKKSSPIFLEVFSDYGTPYAIVPAEQAQQSMGRLDPVVGTGPYRFVEWVPDSHVKLARFDAYAAASGGGPNGFGGKKTAYLDTINFRIIKEDGARVAALETGEVQVVEQLPTEAANRLAKSRKADIQIHDYPRYWIQNGFFNMVNPPFDKLEIRRAVQIALNMEEIMDVATDGAFELDASWQYPGTPYHTDAGKEFYNAADATRAKELLKQGGYKGEEIVLMTNSSYQDMYKAALVIEQQLKGIGMNVKLTVLDWPTSIQVRNKDRHAWHLFMGAMGSTIPLGPALAVSQLTGPGRTQFAMDPKWDALYERLLTEPTPEKRLEAWKEAQAYMYESALVLKLGNTTVKQAARANVRGFKPYRAPRMWDVWLE